jgi:hypothetical protein
MSRCAAHIRDEEAFCVLEPVLNNELNSVFANGCVPQDLPGLLKFRDKLLTQLALLSAVRAAGHIFGSRGSSLITRNNGDEVFPQLAEYRYAPAKDMEVNMALYTKKTPDGFTTRVSPVRPVPDRDTWFETVWNAYNSKTFQGVSKICKGL